MSVKKELMTFLNLIDENWKNNEHLLLASLENLDGSLKELNQKIDQKTMSGLFTVIEWKYGKELTKMLGKAEKLFAIKGNKSLEERDNYKIIKMLCSRSRLFYFFYNEIYKAWEMQMISLQHITNELKFPLIYLVLNENKDLFNNVFKETVFRELGKEKEFLFEAEILKHIENKELESNAQRIVENAINGRQKISLQELMKNKNYGIQIKLFLNDKEKNKEKLNKIFMNSVSRCMGDNVKWFLENGFEVPKVKSVFSRLLGRPSEMKNEKDLQFIFESLDDIFFGNNVILKTMEKVYDLSSVRILLETKHGNSLITLAKIQEEVEKRKLEKFKNHQATAMDKADKWFEKVSDMIGSKYSYLMLSAALPKMGEKNTKNKI